MTFTKNIFLLFAIAVVLLGSPGYRDVIQYDKGFIAISGNGQIDWFSETGELIQTKNIKEKNLNSLIVRDQQVIVAGKQGIIYSSQNNSSFQKIESGTIENINCLALFRNKIIAGTDNGGLLIEKGNNSFENQFLELKGNIVSLSSGTSDCYGVTNKGEIIHSKDGQNWSIFDFNKAYNGFYKASTFIKVLVTPKQIAVIGEDVDHYPVLLFSSSGSVWSESPLNYTDTNGTLANLSDIPCDLFYDQRNEQYILACSNGKLMTIPSCSHCQKLYHISNKDITGISGNQNAVIVVGDKDYFEIIDAKIF
jgi:hypothetical protein